MIRTMVCALGAILFLSACGSDTSGTGGSTGGTGGTGGATGGTGGVTGGTGGVTGGTGGTGGVTGGTGGCSAPVDNVYDNATAEDLANNCIPIAPATGEDGTFAVTLFGPFSTPFTVTGFTFGAHEAANTMVTDPWIASVTVVPAGQDPTAIDPSVGAKPYDLMTPLESMPVGNGTGNKYSVTLDAPLEVGACDSVVVSLRNSEGPPVSAVEMCGLPSAHPETNLWWNLDGTMDVMADLAPGFDHNWWVSLVPAAK